MPHGPCGGDDRTPGTTGGSTGCNFCHGFAALHTGFYGCRSGVGCCFRTFFRRLLCGLLSGIFGGFCCLPAAWPILSEPSPICCFCGSAILSPPYSNCQKQAYFLFYIGRQPNRIHCSDPAVRRLSSPSWRLDLRLITRFWLTITGRCAFVPHGFRRNGAYIIAVIDRFSVLINRLAFHCSLAVY